MRVIFSGDHLDVYYHEGNSSDKIFISFSAWNSQGHGVPFGVSFFKKRGIETYYICQRQGNNWWHTHEIIEVAKRVNRSDKEVILYGSSMGGYAACHLQKMFSASQSIAIAPQIFIDRKINIMENRWSSDISSVNSRLIFDERSSIGECIAPVHIFYDPLNALDANHVKLLGDVRWGDVMNVIQVPYGNHDIARVLNNSGILKDILSSAIDGKYTYDIARRCSNAYLKDKKCFFNFYRHYLKKNKDSEYKAVFDEHVSDVSNIDFEALYMLSECYLYMGDLYLAEKFIKSSLEKYKNTFSKEPPEYLLLKLRNIEKLI